MSEQNVNYNIKNADGSYKELRFKAYDLNGHGTDNGPNSVLLSGRYPGSTVGDSSIAEGSYNVASGNYSHAEGSSSTASGVGSHAEGGLTKASGNYSHAEGQDTVASDFAHAEGYETLASGPYAHAECLNTTASGLASHAEGEFTIADVYYMHAMGEYNKPSSALEARFVIGNGTGNTARANIFRINSSGNTYGVGAFNTSGADYAEYFEWQDENPNKEDRAGHFVTLDGEKIKYANDGDYVVGIVSGAPAIVGDHPSESWAERYMKDIFGRIQYHSVNVPEQTETVTKADGTTETIVIRPAHTEVQPVVNPDYDASKENAYQNRESRPEWAAVGMVGKLVCIDDGTCEVNGYCKPKSGVAVKADTGYRVIARLDSTHIKVLIK